MNFVKCLVGIYGYDPVIFPLSSVNTIDFLLLNHPCPSGINPTGTCNVILNAFFIQSFYQESEMLLLKAVNDARIHGLQRRGIQSRASDEA